MATMATLGNFVIKVVKVVVMHSFPPALVTISFCRWEVDLYYFMWIFQHFHICIITHQLDGGQRCPNMWALIHIAADSSSPPSLVIPRLFNTSVLNPTAGKRCLASQSASSAADHLHVMIHPELTIRADYLATRPSWVCVCLCRPFSFSRAEKLGFSKKAFCVIKEVGLIHQRSLVTWKAVQQCAVASKSSKNLCNKVFWLGSPALHCMGMHCPWQK